MTRRIALLTATAALAFAATSIAHDYVGGDGSNTFWGHDHNSTVRMQAGVDTAYGNGGDDARCTRPTAP